MGQLPFRYKRMGRWWGKTTVRQGEKSDIQETEIDLLAISADKDKYLVGECKFKGKPFTYGDFLDTAVKLSPQKETAEFYYYLFSESGFADKLSGEAHKSRNINLVRLDDIVKLK